MAKTNPFIKGLSPAELAKLRRKAPYIDQVYNPETNEVNYDIILSRLNDTTKKVSDVEQIFLNQVKRNLQREYWANSMQKKDITKTDETFSTDKDSVKNPQAGFSNYTQGEVGRYSTNVPTANQFFPEEFSRYVKGLGGYIQGKYYHPDRYGYAILPIDPQDSHYRAEKYYMERMFADQPDKTTGDAAWLTAFHAERKKNPSLSRPAFVEKYQKEKILPAIIGNLTRAETYFNRINEGITSANQRYANAKKTAEELRAQRVRTEAAQASYQRQKNFNKEKFNEALKTDLANSTQDKQISALSEIRGNQLEEARTHSDQKIENERIKSQEAILNKAAAKQSIPAGRTGLNFIGMRQGNTRSNAVLRVMLGRNRIFGQGGSTDTGVLNQFLDMISPQKNNRSKK